LKRNFRTNQGHAIFSALFYNTQNLSFKQGRILNNIFVGIGFVVFELFDMLSLYIFFSPFQQRFELLNHDESEERVKKIFFFGICVMINYNNFYKTIIL
jgi:hypothetical protein